MALQGTYNVAGNYSVNAANFNTEEVAPPAIEPWSVPFQNAYVRVESVMFNDVTARAGVTVYSDATKATKLQWLDFLFAYDLAGANGSTQAYVALKADVRFAGFADVLEAGQTA